MPDPESAYNVLLPRDLYQYLKHFNVSTNSELGDWFVYLIISYIISLIYFEHRT